MFQVLLKRKDNSSIGKITNLEWYLNSELLPYDIDYVDIFHLYASEKELDFIYENFEGIPIASTHNSCLWKGDLARFLFDNICLINKK